MNRSINDDFTAAFLCEIELRLLKESWPRLEQCLTECDEKLLWFRPNSQTNSIGNLVLHLEGNVKQWLLHGVGDVPDVRDRTSEFVPNQSHTSRELLNRMTILKKDVEQLLIRAKTFDLLSPRKIQVFETTALGAFIHVTEHFSYHVGQITYLVKWQKEKDMGYYKDFELD